MPLPPKPPPAPGADAPAPPRTWLGWIRRWGISLCSLGLGVATLLVFRRGLPHVGWIVGYLLLLVLLVAAITELRQPLEERGQRLVVGAAEYAVQTLYHGLLLFVLPAYWASATFDSPNVVFLVCVVAGALITAVDPWYASVVRPRRWLSRALLAFSIFAALNVALPLLRIRPILALEGSAALTALAMMPVFRERGALTWRGASWRSAALAVVALPLVWFARDAPAGLHQGIEHVWWKDGRRFARIALSPVRGGRKEGFRTYSRKTDLKTPYEGRYHVDVMTASGQLIGRLRFTVTP